MRCPALFRFVINSLTRQLARSGVTTASGPRQRLQNMVIAPPPSSQRSNFSNVGVQSDRMLTGNHVMLTANQPTTVVKKCWGVAQRPPGPTPSPPLRCRVCRGGYYVTAGTHTDNGRRPSWEIDPRRNYQPTLTSPRIGYMMQSACLYACMYVSLFQASDVQNSHQIFDACCLRLWLGIWSFAAL